MERGKNALINQALKNIEDIQNLLADLGKSLVLREEVYRNVVMFVMRYVYNDKKSNNLADSRSLIWKRMRKKTTQRLSPAEDSLKLHINRCNYVAHVLDYRSPAALPSPRYHGWEIVNGECTPIRYEKPALPESMSRVVETETEDGAENDENASEDKDDDVIKGSDDEDSNEYEPELEDESCDDEY